MYEDAISAVNFSDDDGDVEAIVNAQAIAMELAQSSSSKVNIYTSSPFYNPKEETTSYVVFHGNAERKRNPFYLYKEDLQKSMAVKNTKTFILKQAPSGDGKWIPYITNYKVRRNPHDNDSKYKRNDKGYPTEMFGYAVKVKGKLSDDELSTQEMLRFRMFFQEPVRTEKRALVKCKALLASLKDSSSHRLYMWLMEQKGKDEEKVAQTMAKEASNWVKDGAIHHKKVSLDRFMVDYDIKQFLIDHLSCGGWDDINESDKRHCFKNYPRKELPDWDTITKEEIVPGIKA